MVAVAAGSPVTYYYRYQTVGYSEITTTANTSYNITWGDSTAWNSTEPSVCVRQAYNYSFREIAQKYGLQIAERLYHSFNVDVHQSICLPYSLHEVLASQIPGFREIHARIERVFEVFWYRLNERKDISMRARTIIKGRYDMCIDETMREQLETMGMPDIERDARMIEQADRFEHSVSDVVPPTVQISTADLNELVTEFGEFHVNRVRSQYPSSTVSEMRARLALLRHQEQEREERDRNIIQARQRAELLLLSCLTPAQRKSYRLNKNFVVIGGRSKQRYKIERERSMNVYLLGGNNKPMRKFCATVQQDDLPIDDCILAQAMMLQGDEDAFLRVANSYPC